MPKVNPLPPFIETLVESLRDTENKLEKSRDTFIATKKHESEFVSSQKVFQRAQELEPEVNFNTLVSELEKQQVSLQKASTDVERPFLQYEKNHLELDFLKSSYIAAMQAAAHNFYLAAQENLRTAKDKKTALATILPACECFADCAIIKYDETEGLVFSTVANSRYDSFETLVKSFDGRLKKVRTVLAGLGTWTRWSVEAQIKAAIDFLDKKIQEMVADNPTQLKDKFSLVAKGSDSTLAVGESVVAQEKVLATLVDECARRIDKYKPSGSVPQRRRSQPEVTHFAEEIKSAEIVFAETRAAIHCLQVTQDELEEQSKKEHKAIINDLDAYTTDGKNAARDLKAATEQFVQNYNHVEMGVRQEAYQNFEAVLETSSKFNANDRKQKMTEKLAALQIQFGGEITTKTHREVEAKSQHCEQVFQPVLNRARQFKEENKGVFLKLQQEKLQKQVIDLLMQVIFNNLEFWNQQLYCGMSQYAINNVKVPNGISTVANVLYSKKSLLQKIEEVVQIFEQRKNAGPKRFLFFTVRSDATAELYRTAAYLKDAGNLTQEKVNEFQNSLYRIGSINARLKFSSNPVPVKEVHEPTLIPALSR